MTAGPVGSAAASNATLPLPTWALRDAWTYTVSSGAEATYVVTADQGADWLVETDSAERAFANARDDVSRLGPQRKADLAGSQGTDRIEFFHWPLTDNATWTTTWDHQQLHVTARVQPPLAHLEAHALNGTLAYRYTYDGTVRWFRDITAYKPDGTEAISLKLTKAQRNWTGQVARWDLKTVVDEGGDIASGLHGSGSFDVPLTATDVWVRYTFTCTQGTLLIGVAPFPIVTSIAGTEGRGAGSGGTPCPQTDAFMDSAGPPKAPAQGGAETWAWSATSTPGSVGHYELEAVVRTLTLADVA